MRCRYCLSINSLSWLLKRLQHVDLLINYASRHIDILAICNIFNQRINIFLNIWILLSLFAIIFNAVNFFTSISNWSTTILSILLITIWTINMCIVLRNCFSLYMQIRRTRYLLLYEKNIWQNANEKVFAFFFIAICLLFLLWISFSSVFSHLGMAL